MFERTLAPRPACGLKMSLFREIDLWVVQLHGSEQHLAQCLGWLSPDEEARAGRFRFDEHRQAFIFSRGVLRALIGRMEGINPAQIRFSYGAKGKPALADPARPLRFNLSHSAGLAAYAFAVGCEIGVDVEQVRPVPDMRDIAARFFAPEETSEVMHLSESDISLGFFNCWTRKEAYIKAVGDGLSVPLDSFRVTLRPGVEAAMLTLGGDTEQAKAWTIQAFTPAPGFVAALAYLGPPRLLRLRPLVGAGELLDSPR